METPKPDRKRRSQQVPMAERWANDRWPDRQAPKLAANGALKLDPRVLNKALGVVLGSAVGDALGGRRAVAADPTAEHRFGHPTSLAVAEAQSFIEVGDIAPEHTAERLGLLPNGGAGADQPDNEALVLARAGFVASRWSFTNPAGTAEVARRFASTTDASHEASEARALLQVIVAAAVSGINQNDPFRLPAHMDGGDATEVRLTYIDESVHDVAAAALRGEGPTEPGTSPWTVLGHAVAAVRTTDSFEACMSSIATPPDSSRATAAVAGMIAGGIYGLDSIPAPWTEALTGDVGGEQFDASVLRELATQMLAVEQPS